MHIPDEWSCSSLYRVEMKGQKDFLKNTNKHVNCDAAYEGQRSDCFEKVKVISMST